MLGGSLFYDCECISTAITYMSHGTAPILTLWWSSKINPAVAGVNIELIKILDGHAES